MVLATASHPHEASGTKQPYGVRSHQLPLMRLSRQKRDAPETSPCRHDGHSKRMARSPQGDGLDWRRRGNRDPRPALVPAKTASAQLVTDSSVGPHRSIASAGVRTLVLFQVDLVHSAGQVNKPDLPNRTASIVGQVSNLTHPTGHRSGGQSKRDGVGHVPHRDIGGRASKDRRGKRGRRWCPS